MDVKIGATSKDGTIILYIDGKRYVYWMDALYHKQIERLLTPFKSKGRLVPARPGQALKLINHMLASGAAEQIDPKPRPKYQLTPNLEPKEDTPSCPHCKTPGYLQGIECPGCGVKESFSFKKWMIREMAYCPLPPKEAEELGFDAIDFRFEDYPEDTSEEKQLKSKLLIYLNTPPFYAKLPQSDKFIHFTGSTYVVRKGLPEKTKALMLPEYWWDYAAIYVGNFMLKKPKKHREGE